MASFVLSEREMAQLAEELITREDFTERIAAVIGERISEQADGWMGAKEAAAYLGLSVDALHKLSAARAIPFEQAGPHCKLWFRRAALDTWRQVGQPSSVRLRRAA